MTLGGLASKARNVLADAFSRPKLLACASLSEVLPLDLLVLRLQVQGWGRLDIRSDAGWVLRQFFRNAGTLQVAVPVRASLTLRVSNAWGSRTYPIDTYTRRDEVWRAPTACGAPDLACQLRLPTDLQPAYPHVDVCAATLPRMASPPPLVSRVPLFALRASPCALKTPGLAIKPLPSMHQPITAPSRPELPAWGAQATIEPLDSRMQRARIAR